MKLNTQKLLLLSLVFSMVFTAVLPYNAKASNNLLPLDVYISSDHLAQADTLLVVVKNEPGNIKGTLGAIKMRFFKSQDTKDWVAIVGMTLNKKPGDYKLSITVEGKQPFEKIITVAKRDFPVTKLEITPELLKKGYTAKKIITNIQTIENKALSKVLNVLTPQSYVSKPFTYPLSETTVVGPFGDIRASKNYKIQHLGVDLKAPLGTPVFAVNDGKVVLIKKFTDYGNTIVIDHGLGMYSLYLHLSHFNAIKGDMVKQGDVIGLSGDTGYATGPHLHFGIKVRGASLDPLRFIQTTQANW